MISSKHRRIIYKLVSWHLFLLLFSRILLWFTIIRMYPDVSRDTSGYLSINSRIEIVLGTLLMTDKSMQNLILSVQHIFTATTYLGSGLPYSLQRGIFNFVAVIGYNI